MYGFIKNKIIFLRIGFITLAATVVTIFYFYPFVSGEIWLIVGGSIMIIAGYAGMRFFKNSKYGFTANSYTSLSKELITAEALTTVQSAYKSSPVESIQFGGGSSGGAGASGNWCQYQLMKNYIHLTSKWIYMCCQINLQVKNVRKFSGCVVLIIHYN